MPRYVSDFRIEFGKVGAGQWESAPEELREDINQIIIEESLHLPTLFTIAIANPYFPGETENNPWKYEHLFEFGGGVRLGLANSTAETPEFDEDKFSYLIEGEITAIESHFDANSQAPIIIRGYDISHRLHRGRYTRSFQNMKDCDIVRRMIADVGIAAADIEEDKGPYGYSDIHGTNGYVFQRNQTNMEFLQERAARNGFELFVADNKLHFHRPRAETTLELKWLETLTSFRVRANSAEQVDQVEVRGWDYKSKNMVTAVCRQDATLTHNQRGTGQAAGSKIAGLNTNPQAVVVDQPFFALQEAQTLADALFNEISGEFITADARAIGDPELRPRRVVKLNNMGKYSGEYYVTETRHVYDGTYSTEFSVRGLRGGTLASVIAPQPRSSLGQTPMVGIVTDNRDPNDWGRVRVKLPTLTEDHNSYWARIVSADAGGGRGSYSLPEINDEVLVAFEHGDIHRPYIIGSVWNGKDAPPTNIDATLDANNSQVRLRTWRTPSGHQLQFVETDRGRASQVGTYLTTAAGHQLALDDTARTITLSTPQRQRLEINDPSQTVNLQANRTINLDANQSINLRAHGQITLSVGATQIQLTPAGINLRTPGQITLQGGSIALQGGMIRLN